MIVVAGLSPAWQHILGFDAFQVGAVNRAEWSLWCASGKVLNVARALRRLGTEARTVCVAGGTSGQSIRDDIAREGIDTCWIDSGVACRVCTTILDRSSATTTELVENAAPLPEETYAEFGAAFARAGASADYAILTGSLPRNAPAGYFGTLLESTPARALLDIRGSDLLAVLDRKPLLVKPNRAELAETLGRDLHSDKVLVSAMRELNARGAEWVAISDGSRALWATAGNTVLRIEPPRVETINPIGCGDCLLAGMAAALAHKQEMREALRWGVAVAAESARRRLPAGIEADRISEFVSQVRIEEFWT